MNDVNYITYRLKALEDTDKDVLAEDVFLFSQNNLHKVSADYIKKRIYKNDILIVAKDHSKTVGIQFSRYNKIKVVINIPQVWFGLTIVDESSRGKRIARGLTTKTMDACIKYNHKRSLLLGCFISAKCSSPISFRKLSEGFFKFNIPILKKDNKSVIASKFGNNIAFKIKKCVELDDQHADFLIRDVNANSDYYLQNNKFISDSRKDKVIVDYFNQEVFPKNELMFVTWCHPLIFKMFYRV